MKLKVDYISIEQLKAYEKNAKIHTPEQIEQIKNSIQEFGMNDPIGIWGEDNLIIEGHGRLQACKELGMKEVPCEHHLALMYNMTVTVAYVPKEVEGRYQVIGLSKIPRIVNLCAKRLQLQERLAQDISECLSMATGSESVYVNIKADHACVSARGAKSDGFTDVTNLTGLFRTNSDLRKEVEMKVK